MARRRSAPGGRYREPVIRDDLNAAVDWHFVVFRSENAIPAGAAAQMLDILVERLERGVDELKEYKVAPRAAMDEVLDAYERSSLPHQSFVSRASQGKR